MQATQPGGNLWKSSGGIFAAVLILAACSWLGCHFYMEHQKRLQVETQLAAEEQARAQAEAEEQARITAVRAAQQREISESTRQMLDAQAYSATHNYGRDSSAGHQPATRQRSAQEDYALAGSIMEDGSNEYRQQNDLAASGLSSNGSRVDQSAMNQSMLAMYEKHCLPFGKGSVEYKHCRADFKQSVLNQCQQVPSGKLNPEQEAQCYAAVNYRAVE
jgi:hypothetical protein